MATSYRICRRRLHDSPRLSRLDRRRWRSVSLTLEAGSAPQRARLGMVITQSDIASQIGFQVIKSGGNAIDAAVATAFALAVTHPTAGNIGGGGFIVYRPATGEPMSYDFREDGAGAVVAGDVAEGRQVRLRDASQQPPRRSACPARSPACTWRGRNRASKPWKELVQPAIALARDGFEVSHGLARSLAGVLDDFQKYPASLAQFSKNGKPYEAGEILKQPDLAKTLTRIADQGPAGFYEGETAALIEKEMKANGGLITMARSQGLPGQEARRRQGHLSRLRRSSACRRRAPAAWPSSRC